MSQKVTRISLVCQSRTGATQSLFRRVKPCTQQQVNSSSALAERKSPWHNTDENMDLKIRTRTTAPLSFNLRDRMDQVQEPQRAGRGEQRCSEPRLGKSSEQAQEQRFRTQGPPRSAELLRAIQHIGCTELYGKPAAGKNDLSYVSARKAGTRHRAIRGDRGGALQPPVESMTVQHVLARYLLGCAPNSRGTSFRKPLSPVEERILSAQGFTSRDLPIWTAILLEDARSAASILTSGRKLPSFLLTFYLRRQHIPGDALHRLLDYFSNSLITSRPDLDHVRAQLLDPAIGVEHMVLAVRLLRHARQSSIVSLQRVSAFLLDLCGNARASVKSQGTRGHDSLLSEYNLNRILSLLSLPVQHDAMVAVATQEKLQFDVVRFMGSQARPIQVNAEGYRGLIRVQLAMGKTDPERRWAILKSKSWPPWKEDRTGMDAHITPDDGISRADQVMRWMQQAGYKTPRWMSSAKIFAGWDTDQSPTIQLRTFERWVTADNSPATTWAARIASTRTLTEAWASFLAAKERYRKPHMVVYHEMFKKLLSAQLEIGHDTDSHNRPFLAGDGPVVFPENVSPYEQTYVSRPPPTVDHFLWEMLEAGMRPRGKLLDLLLRESPSIDFGAAVLANVSLQDRELLRRVVHPDHDSRTHAVEIYAPRLEAYLTFLHKAIGSDWSIWEKITFQTNDHIRFDTVCSRKEMIAKAFVNNERMDQRPWYSLLSLSIEFADPLPRAASPLLDGQAKSGMLESLNRTSEFRNDLFKHMQDQTIGVNGPVFQKVCQHAMAASKAAARRYRSCHELRAWQKDVSTFLRRQFQKLVQPVERHMTGTSKVDTAGRRQLLRVPKPSICHYYVMALGALDDVDGLHSLAIFLQLHSQELAAVAESLRSGKRYLRMTLVALRTYLEKDWATDETEDLRNRRCEVVQMVKDIVEAEPDWDGWPSDEEVAEYCAKSTIGHQ